MSSSTMSSDMSRRPRRCVRFRSSRCSLRSSRQYGAPAVGRVIGIRPARRQAVPVGNWFPARPRPPVAPMSMSGARPGDPDDRRRFPAVRGWRARARAPVRSSSVLAMKKPRPRPPASWSLGLPPARRAGRDIGLADPVDDAGGEARPVVGDGDATSLVVPFGADRRPRRSAKSTAFSTRLARPWTIAGLRRPTGSGPLPLRRRRRRSPRRRRDRARPPPRSDARAAGGRDAGRPGSTARSAGRGCRGSAATGCAGARCRRRAGCPAASRARAPWRRARWSRAACRARAPRRRQARRAPRDAARGQAPSRWRSAPWRAGAPPRRRGRCRRR